MSKTVLYAVTSVVCLLLQAAIAPALSLGGCSPNFLFIPVLAVALYSGSIAGGVAGFAFGLVFDLASSGVVGCMALVLTAVAMIVGALAANGGMRSPVVVCIVAVLAVFLSEVLYGVVVMLTNVEATGALRTLATHSLPQALYSSVFACVALVTMGIVVAEESPSVPQGQFGGTAVGRTSRFASIRSRLR